MSKDLKLAGQESAASSDAPGHGRKEGKRTKLATSHKIAGHADIQLIGGDWKFQKKPAFITERNAYWDQLYAAQTEKVKTMPNTPITVTLPDGNTKQGVAFQTSPLDVAKMISNQLAKKIIVAEVRYPNGRQATLDEGV